MSKAKEAALSDLHGELARVLMGAITREYTSEDGDTLPPPAAILNVARQFLKDNKIEALAVQGSPLAGLADLPLFDDSDNIFPFTKTGT